LKASLAASAKISLASKPSSLPNLDMPALTMLTSGFPFKREVPSQMQIRMPSLNKNYATKTLATFEKIMRHAFAGLFLF
jgi:hypothetical protein